jgi:hypothetical protein
MKLQLVTLGSEASVANMVILGTGNSRQSGSNRALSHANLPIPYQHRIDIVFVPIFPNAWVLARANSTRHSR